jgi:hypothetical protein
LTRFLGFGAAILGIILSMRSGILGIRGHGRSTVPSAASANKGLKYES